MLSLFQAHPDQFLSIISLLSIKQNNPEELSRALNLFFKSRSKGLESDEAK
jgi:hypothetical protein